MRHDRVVEVNSNDRVTARRQPVGLVFLRELNAVVGLLPGVRILRDLLVYPALRPPDLKQF